MGSEILMNTVSLPKFQSLERLGEFDKNWLRKDGIFGDWCRNAYVMQRYPTYDFVEYFGKLQNLKCECKSFVEATATPQHNLKLMIIKMHSLK